MVDAKKSKVAKQTRRQFFKEFVGPPRRPATLEERRVGRIAYEAAMAEYRRQCGAWSEYKNRFHRVADAEQSRADGAAMLATVRPEFVERRTTALNRADTLLAAMGSPRRGG